MRRDRLVRKITGALSLVVVSLLFVRMARERKATPLPEIVLEGRPRGEGCLVCHLATAGLGSAHDPRVVGCSPCHLGDPSAREQAAAHRGMTVLSGDLATVDATCGRPGCHVVEAARVKVSLMAGAPGILAVDRFAFGERPTPEGRADDDLRALDPASSPAGAAAESHARKLCASCHLAAHKERPGDEGERARGGGCTACHLAPPSSSAAGARVHPDVSAVVAEVRCQGCHSRSGRIAMSFHGTVELEPTDRRVTSRLADGRPVGAAPPDVHARAGMTCIDCHAERDVMGDGAAHRHAHEGVEIACDDCHAEAAARPPPDPDRARVAAVLRASWASRGMPALASGPPLATRAGTPLFRTDASARTLLLATTGERRAIPVATQKRRHTLPGHERLSCQACHTAWAPRCSRCHTTFDPEGADVDHLSGKRTAGRWLEEAGGNGYGPPVLALDPRGKIAPFVEGMTLRLDGAPARVERVLWAPLDAHTTAASRACSSCHTADALASVLPAEGETTRVGARLLGEAERARVAFVARCVGCHERYEDVIWDDFPASRARIEARGRGESPRDRRAERCKLR